MTSDQLSDAYEESALRAKRQPREVRQQQILDAAVQVFSAHGYHAASMDEISTAAGVSKPMIYAYLGAKENLFSACLRRESTRMIEAIVAAVQPDLPPDVQMWHGLCSFFGFVEAHRDSWRVLHRQVGTADAPFGRELEEIRSRAITLVSALLVTTASTAEQPEVGEAAIRSGEALAAALVGAAESLADWWLDHPEEPANAIAARLMNLVWMGFGDLLADRVWQPPGNAKRSGKAVVG